MYAEPEKAGKARMVPETDSLPAGRGGKNQRGSGRSWVRAEQRGRRKGVPDHPRLKERENVPPGNWGLPVGTGRYGDPKGHGKSM